jgi:hypothetical protein
MKGVERFRGCATSIDHRGYSCRLSGRRHPLYRDMGTSQQTTNDPFVPPNRNPILFRTGHAIFRCSHHAPIRPIRRRQLCQNRKQFIRLQMDFRVVRSVKQRHPVRADDQVGIFPVLQILEMVVLGSIRRRNRLQDSLRVRRRSCALMRTSCERHACQENCCQTRPERIHQPQFTSPSPERHVWRPISAPQTIR